MNERRPTSGTRKWPPLWLAFLHIAALWALGAVQPLFDLLGKDATFFVVRDSTVGDILIFAFAFALLPPLVLTGVVALAGLAALDRVALVVIVGALAAFVALQFLDGVLPDKSAVQFPVAAAVGAGVAYLYRHKEPVRSFFSMLSPAPAVFLALFLVFSQVGDILFPSESSASPVAAATSRTPVVLLVFDELPTTTLMDAEKRIDADRYPGFGELAAGSTWYRNASSVADGTTVAVPPILTGDRPEAELESGREFPRNVFTMLDSRYDIHAYEPITWVCAPEVCRSQRPPESQGDRLQDLYSDLKIVLGHLVLPEDMREDLAPIDRGWEDFGNEAAEGGGREAVLAARENAPTATSARGPLGAPLVKGGIDTYTDRLIDGLRTLRAIEPVAGDRPPLYAVHFVMPHVPWRFLPSGHQYPPRGATIPGLEDPDWLGDPYLVGQGLQRHHLQAAYADRILREAIRRLKRAELWDDALVVVTADHGANFRAGSARRPVERENFHEQAGVPLFVRYPGQDAPEIDDKPAQTIDVLPTIAKLTGGGSGWDLDGVPLDGPIERDTLAMRNGRDNELIELGFDEFVRRRDAELRRQLELFPAGGDPFAYGPNPGLVGRTVSSLTVTGGGGSATFDGAAEYADVRPGTGVVPAWIGGNAGGSAPGTPLAVAVNGRVRGVGQVYEDRGRARFGILVPAASFRRGANRVELFTVSGGDGLQRIAST